MSEPLMNLCSSSKMQPIRDLISKVAGTNTTVLLRGESGVGKEVVARAIHKASPRAGKQFLKVNCAALPGELLESELFGHEKGAFTGAYRQKPGKFEAAHQGTLWALLPSTRPSCLNTSPLFITNSTRSSTLISASGSPRTATMSACFPAAMVPIRASSPSSSAAVRVPA